MDSRKKKRLKIILFILAIAVLYVSYRRVSNIFVARKARAEFES